MKVLEIKQKAASNLLSQHKNIDLILYIYFAIVIIYNIFHSVGMSLNFCSLLILSYIMGRFDLEKANFFIKLMRNNTSNKLNLSEISAKISDKLYKIFLHCYIRKYLWITIFFNFFCSNTLYYLKIIISQNGFETLVTKNDDIFLIFIDIISLFLFIYILLKYIFIEYILAERCSKAITDDVLISDIEYERYDFKDDCNFTLARKYLSKEVYRENKKLVKNNLFLIVKFVFSFLGWFLLSLVTFGLGFVFLIPYFNAATALLYLDLKEKQKE